jgi:DNA-binding response OmpR family regulator
MDPMDFGPSSLASNAADPRRQRGQSSPDHLVCLISRRSRLIDLVHRALPREHFRLLECEDAEERLSEQPEIFLLDLGVGPEQLGAVIERVRTDLQADAATPIVGVGMDSVREEDRLTSLSAGLWDCLLLPERSSELAVKLDNFVGAKRAADTLKATSLLDTESDFYNVRGLLRRLTETVAAADRAESALGCVVLEADAALEWEAAAGLVPLLTKICRTSDVVGRLSDRRYVIIAPETGPDRAPLMVDRLLREIDSRLSTRAPYRDAPVRAGYSVVGDVHESGIRPLDLLSRAQRALEEGRNEGNGGAGAFDP